MYNRMYKYILLDFDSGLRRGLGRGWRLSKRNFLLLNTKSTLHKNRFPSSEFRG